MEQKRRNGFSEKAQEGRRCDFPAGCTKRQILEKPQANGPAQDRRRETGVTTGSEREQDAQLEAGGPLPQAFDGAENILRNPSEKRAETLVQCVGRVSLQTDGSPEGHGYQNILQECK